MIVSEQVYTPAHTATPHFGLRLTRQEWIDHFDDGDLVTPQPDDYVDFCIRSGSLLPVSLPSDGSGRREDGLE